MDDEDDRRLLDIIGDVQALNDYLHGSNKSIEEDDVTNAACAEGNFFTENTASSDSVLKDGSASLGEEFGEEDSSGAGLQLSNSLSFMEEELGDAASSGGGGGGVEDGLDGEDGEDQPFDILQKSLLEADITEQTLAQEALLDSQPAPAPPDALQAAAPFPSQLVSGGYGGGGGGRLSTAASFPGGQFLQGVSHQLPNGSAGHIQVVGAFGGGGGVMTLSSLERSPQILLRPGGPAGAVAGGQVFAPASQVGQVGLPFKNIPLQNIIIQRGPGGTQTLVRPIQPKPLQTGSQTVYSLAASSVASVGGAYTTANGSIVVHSPLGQGQQGQYLFNAVHNGPADHNANTLLTNQNEVQLIAAGGQNFTATAGGQLILNQGSVSHTWSTFPGTITAPAQASANQGRLTLVGPATAGLGRGQLSGSPVQRLLVTQTQNSTSLSPLPVTANQEQQDYGQDSSSPGLPQDCRQTQLVNLLGIKAVKTMTCIGQESLLNAQVSAQKRPASQQLTRGGMLLQRLRKDHSGVLAPDYTAFTSLDDALHRLLPYHVFQGAPPNQDEFSLVDDEFESVATQVLKRTQAMVNKYRRLLMVEAERSSPSSEIVMIDRTFNQEERSNLTQDRRMLLVDPDGFLEDFCCGVKSSSDWPEACLPPAPASSCSQRQAGRGPTEPPYRTDPEAGYRDPGGGGGGGEGGGGGDPPSAQSILDLKRTQHERYGAANANTSNNSLVAGGNYFHGNLSSSSLTTEGQTHYQASPSPSHPSQPPPLSTGSASPPPPDTDSVLEAAVNSILEC